MASQTQLTLTAAADLTNGIQLSPPRIEARTFAPIGV